MFTKKLLLNDIPKNQINSNYSSICNSQTIFQKKSSNNVERQKIWQNILSQNINDFIIADVISTYLNLEKFPKLIQICNK